MTCPGCGSPCEMGDHFCPSCGRELAATATESPAQDAAGSDVARQIAELLRQRQKIQAIKLYREATGASLVDAKNAVEQIASRAGIPCSGSGCAGAALVVGLICGAVAWLAILR